MPKVYATVPGAEVVISHPSGWQGTATNEQPALVSEAVAQDLAGIEGLRVEPDDDVRTLRAGHYRTAKDLSAAIAKAAADEKE
jgi:hypothetical protein